MVLAEYRDLLENTWGYALRRNEVDETQVKEIISQFIEILSRRNYEPLGSGTKRITFLSPNKKFVIKVPRRLEGFSDNSREARMWKSGRDFPREQLARCKLHKSGILVMEFISPVSLEKYPDWTDFIDCRQVGLNRKGQLVAYDYA